MEMEHINENTIRVVIGNEDLAERGISFLDLLGNHKEIETFFYSILEEVDIEEEFRGSEAVTFQVLPKGDGLELFISKNLPDEELAQSGDFAGDPEEVSEFLRRQLMDSEETEEKAKIPEAPEKEAVFIFDDFEQMVQLAKDVELESAWTNLYIFEDHYYLDVHFWLEELNKADVDNQIAKILEFANKSDITSARLDEYGKCLMERNALELTNYYFK
ncbi:negative regulator of genetic competence [Enterococcus faecalis 13-SD-W-01]|nr:negative regulator of genetic competence [Enterococcus faecalis 13-SD-W-01]